MAFDVSELPVSIWKSIIVDSGVEEGLLDALRAPGIHRTIDVSDAAMSRAFDTLDREEQGILTKEQYLDGMNRCLTSLGGKAVASGQVGVQALWQAATKDDGLSARDFAQIMRRLRLEILLAPAEPAATTTTAGPEAANLVPKDTSYEQDVAFKTYDFTKNEMHKRDMTEGKLRDFFLTSTKKPNIILNWIVVGCHDYLNILRLAVKYSIHCLHVEDVLKLESQKPKITRHNGNHFTIIPILRLTKETEQALEKWQLAHHKDVEALGRHEPFAIILEEATAGVFSAGPPENDNTVISIRTLWRQVRNKAGGVLVPPPKSEGNELQKEAPRGSSSRRSRATETSRPVLLKDILTRSKTARRQSQRGEKRDNDGEGENDDSGWGNMFDNEDEAALKEEEDDYGNDLYFDVKMMHEVAESVHQTNSDIIGNTAQWLLHSILDHTVDRLPPVVEVYQVRVRFFQELLHKEGPRFGKGRTADVMDTKMDLLWIQRKVGLLRPILKHLLRSVSGDLQLYYQDVDDHLERCMEGLGALIGSAQNIIDEAHSNREDHMNEILFVITIITAVFTPANFLAGVYGTNFVTHDGIPNIPELNWTHGYAYFWLWCFILSGGVVLLVKLKYDFTINSLWSI